MGSDERPWFDRLDGADRQALVAAGRTRTYPPRAVVMEEGMTSGLVLIILSGRVKITTLSMDGRQTTLAAVGTGEILGELSAVDGLPHSATATAIGEVEALVLPAATFLEVIEGHGRLGVQVLQAVVARLRYSDRLRVEFGGGDVVQRVCSLLLELAREHGQPGEAGAVVISPAFSQEELASWVGTSREAVNKALARLRVLGLVDTGRRQLIVRDLKRLGRLAER